MTHAIIDYNFHLNFLYGLIKNQSINQLHHSILIVLPSVTCIFYQLSISPLNNVPNSPLGSMVHYPKEIFLCSSAEESFAIFLHFVVHCVYTRVATLLSFIMIRTQKPSLSLAFVADSKVIVITQILMQIFTIGSTTKPKSYFFPTVFFQRTFFSFLPSSFPDKNTRGVDNRFIYELELQVLTDDIPTSYF